MAAYYPYQGFYFKVIFDGKNDIDTSFQSVKGLEVQFDVETLKEGGLNAFEHTVPVRAKYSTLTLERGIFEPEKSALLHWCKDAFFNFKFRPVNLQIMLMAPNKDNNEWLINWDIRHALPKSWKIKDLNALQSEVLIETLELSYNSFEVKSRKFW